MKPVKGALKLIIGTNKIRIIWASCYSFFLSQKNLFYRKKTSYRWVLQVCNKAQVEEGSDGLAEGVQSDDEGLSLHCHIKADTPIL